MAHTVHYDVQEVLKNATPKEDERLTIGRQGPACA